MDEQFLVRANENKNAGSISCYTNTNRKKLKRNQFIFYKVPSAFFKK